MERLTNNAWRNFDPWECCGQDKYCQRGCHDPGGCTKGCIVPQLYARLGAYEDTRLTPELVQEIAELAIWIHKNGLEKIKKWIKADKDGRLVMLPCKVGDKLYRVFAGEILEHKVRNMRYLAIQGRWDIDTSPFCSYVESSIGKTIFLTHEQAERALEAKSNA
jgi:hypothetical protein